MKQIYPVNCSKITKVEDNPITQQQYEDLVDRTNAVVECAKDVQNDLNCYKECQAKSTKTCELTADSANIKSLTSNTINVENLNVENLHQENLEIACVGTECVYANCLLCTPNVNTCNIYTDNICSTNACIRNICGDTMELSTLCTGSIVSTDSNISCLKVGSCLELDNGSELNVPQTAVANIYCSNLTCTNIEEGNIEKETVVCSKVNTSNVDYLDAKFITHCNYKQVIIHPDLDAYILLPLFTNGLYMLEGQNDTHKRLWSVEVLNSINNIEFRWSESKLGYLSDIKYGTDASGTAVVQIHIDPLLENVTIYEQSISTDNTTPPTIYAEDQLKDISLEDEKSGILIKQLAGTYINNIIFTDKLHIKCLEMDSLFMDCVGIYRKLFLTCDFDQSGDITNPIVTSGEEGQYIINRTHCDIVHPTWESSAETVSLNKDGTGAIPNTMCDSLLASCTVAKYDGTVKNGWTSCNCWHYPITNLGNCTTVHGNATVNCDLTVCHGLDTPHIIDSIDKTEKNHTLTNMTTGNALVVTWTPPAEWTIYNFSTPSIHCSEWYEYTDLGPGNTARYLHKEGCPYDYICTSDGLLEVEGAYYDVDKYSATYKSVGYYDANDVKIGYVTWNQLSHTCIFENNVCCYGYKDANAKGLGPWKRYYEGRYDELAVYDSCSVWDETTDNKPTVYDYESNTIKPSASLALDALEVDNLTVNCNATVGNDLHVGGDLYVEGVTHTVEEETVSTSSDMIVLRQNNPSVISSGQASGIIINNATSDGSIAVVTDSTGTLRIGTPDGISSHYEEIYYKDGHWYTDIEEETEVTPLGELVSWDNKSITENGSTKYVNPTFMQFDYSKLSPVLGRDEISSMTDNALLIFDKASWEAKTLTVPLTDGSSLKYNNVTKEYYWEKSAGVYHFATMQDYLDEESDIPEDSIIVIDDENDYTVSEDKQ